MQIAAVSKYIFICVSVYWSLLCLWLYVCVNSDQSTCKSHVMCQTLNKLDVLLHKTISKVLLVLKYQGVQNNILDVARSHIQPKKQGNKKMDWERGEGVVGRNLEKR